MAGMGASPRPAAGLLSDGGLRRLQAVGGFGGARLRGGEEGQGGHVWVLLPDALGRFADLGQAMAGPARGSAVSRLLSSGRREKASPGCKWCRPTWGESPVNGAV